MVCRYACCAGFKAGGSDGGNRCKLRGGSFNYLVYLDRVLKCTRVEISTESVLCAACAGLGVITRRETFLLWRGDVVAGWRTGRWWIASLFFWGGGTSLGPSGTIFRRPMRLAWAIRSPWRSSDTELQTEIFLPTNSKLHRNARSRRGRSVPQWWVGLLLRAGGTAANR